MVNCTKINVKEGSTGDDVKEVQKYLKYLGLYTGNIDGNCGKLTVTSIKQLQKQENLVQDGHFGSITCKNSGINGRDISGSNITLDIETWLDMIQRYEKYVATNKKEPQISYIDVNNKYQYITNVKYKEIKRRYDEYISKNNKKPNFVYINYPKTITSTPNVTTNSNTTTYTSSPHFVSSGCNKLGQCTSYYCGVHSLRQVLCKFGIEDYKESTLAGWAGTTTAGTSHSGINTAIKKVNSKKGTHITITWKNFSDFGSTTSERFKNLGKEISNSNVDAIIHNLYRNKYGHYEVIKSIDTKNNIVTVLNSLGNRCNRPAYCGYIENRSFNTFASYIANTPGGQPSIGLVMKN